MAGLVVQSAEFARQLALLLPRLRLWTLCLFTNDRAAARQDHLWDYFEPTWPGYARVPLPDWGFVTLDEAGRGTAEAGAVTWTRGPGPGPPSTVRGCFVLDTQGRFVGAGLAPEPVAVDREGDTVTVLPRFLLGQSDQGGFQC